MAKKQMNLQDNKPAEILPENSNIIPGEVETFLKDFKDVSIIDEPLKSNDEPEIKDRKKRNKKMLNSSIISGALFLLFIDLVIPNLISLVNNKVSKKKITAELLKLSNDQRKELEPLADEVARLINLQGNPAMVLSLSLAAIYLSNFMLLKGTK